MTQSQHWSNQNVTSVWSLHVEDMVERMCTEGLLLPFQSFMINWAVFCHCTHISYTGRENVYMNRFSIQCFLYISYHMIDRECITQEINYRNSSPNKQNAVIICHPSCILTSMTTNTIAACASHGRLRSTEHWLNCPECSSCPRKLKRNPEISDSPLEKLLYGFRRLGIHLMTRMDYLHGAFVSFLDLDRL